MAVWRGDGALVVRLAHRGTLIEDERHARNRHGERAGEPDPRWAKHEVIVSASQALEVFGVVGFFGQDVLETVDQPAITILLGLLDSLHIAREDLTLGRHVL